MVIIQSPEVTENVIFVNIPEMGSQKIILRCKIWRGLSFMFLFIKGQSLWSSCETRFLNCHVRRFFWFSLADYFSLQDTFQQFIMFWNLYNITQIPVVHIFDSVDKFNVCHFLGQWYIQDPLVDPEFAVFKPIDYLLDGENVTSEELLFRLC